MAKVEKFKKIVPNEMDDLMKKARMETLYLKLKHACASGELPTVNQLEVVNKLHDEIQEVFFEEIKPNLDFDFGDINENENIIDMSINDPEK